METTKKHGKTWNMVLPCFFLLWGYFAGDIKKEDDISDDQ